jgi:cell division protein FtsQ
VAFARVGSKILLVDATGTLMELPVAGKKKYSFPVILGTNPGEPLSTRAARMKIYCDVMRQLDSSGAHYSQDLSEADLSAPDDVKVLVSDPQGEVLVHLGSSDYLDRYKVYITHVQQWRQQFVKLESVDLRYDRQIIVNPDQGGAVMPAPLSLSAVKNAMAAGVKSAALARYERLPAKPLVGPSPARASMKPPTAAKSSKDLRRRSSAKTTANAARATKHARRHAPPKSQAASPKPSPATLQQTSQVAAKKKPSPAIAKGQEQP